jgi:hypothetical protein
LTLLGGLRKIRGLRQTGHGPGLSFYLGPYFLAIYYLSG